MEPKAFEMWLFLVLVATEIARVFCVADEGA
jgi:hypothetical protein